MCRFYTTTVLRSRALVNTRCMVQSVSCDAIRLARRPVHPERASMGAGGGRECGEQRRRSHAGSVDRMIDRAAGCWQGTDQSQLGPASGGLPVESSASGASFAASRRVALSVSSSRVVFRSRSLIASRRAARAGSSLCAGQWSWVLRLRRIASVRFRVWWPSRARPFVRRQSRPARQAGCGQARVGRCRGRCRPDRRSGGHEGVGLGGCESSVSARSGPRRVRGGRARTPGTVKRC